MLQTWQDLLVKFPKFNATVLQQRLCFGFSVDSAEFIVGVAEHVTLDNATMTEGCAITQAMHEVVAFPFVFEADSSRPVRVPTV